MKLAMLARDPKLYSHRRLVEAAEARGHSVDIINTLQVKISTAAHQPTLFYLDKPLVGYDAMIPRIGASITFYGLAVVRQFEIMGVESERIGRYLSLARQVAFDATARGHWPWLAGHRLFP